MKSLKSKVILSALVLVFALVATIGSTYAWFTVSPTVAVSGMNMNVQSSESLLVRAYDGELGSEAFLLDATAYKASLVLADILTPAATSGYTAKGTYTSLSTWRLSPVTAQQTSVTGTTLNAKSLSLMSITDHTYSTPAVGNNASGNYIDIKFWVLSQGATSEDIVLEDLAITANNGVTAKNAIVNAVKVAAWSEKEYHATTPVTPVSPDGDSKIFGLDNDWGFAFTSGMSGYLGTSADSIDATTKGTLQGLQSMYYKSGATLAANIVTPTIGNAATIATLATNVPELINVRIYIEGWDAQCTNAVLAAIFSISFKFSIKDQGA